MTVYLDCIVCGVEFPVPKWRAKKARSCSHACSVIDRANTIKKSVTLNCPQCLNDFEVPRSHKDRRRFCSNDCREANEAYQRDKSQRYAGAGNPCWKGGIHHRQDGYIYRLVGAEHPFSTADGYMLEHRAVMEKWLRETDPDSECLVQFGEKKYLSPSWHVHHKDEDRANNRRENLMCVTPERHREIHAEMRRKAKKDR